MKTHIDNLSFAQYCIETLISLGVVHFCICPGSRSTPLTVACARNPKAKTYVFHDERSAAFAALGMGKTGVPAVLITTSGTAVANAFPAVIESSLSHVPLIVISGDRPPKLRDSGANQTIDQIKIFGNYTRFFFDIPCPSQDFSQQQLQSIVKHATNQSCGIDAGPVHLNCMFDEPFDMNHTTHPNVSISKLQQFNTELTISPNSFKELQRICQNSTATLIVIGECNSPMEQEHLWNLVKDLDCPLLLDASSGLRLQSSKNTIRAFEYLLRQDDLHSHFTPDVILHFGQGIASKSYEQWLSTLKCLKIQIQNHSNRFDPSSCFDAVVQTQFASCTFVQSISNSRLNPIIEKWNSNVSKIIDTLEMGEIQVTTAIPSFLPPHSNLFISNSMPIRNINNFASSQLKLYSTCNRGASGIDGLISTAAGWCVASQRSTTIVIGDLSTMHDFGVLFTLSQWKIPLNILIINNGGGGIFSHLPIQQERDVFEEFFATAHNHHFAPITESMGIETHSISDLEQLEPLLRESPNHIRIVEIKTDRNSNLQQHQYIKSTLHL